MKIVTVAPLLLLGAALASIEGLPFDNRRSPNSKMHEDWNDAIELARNRSGIPGLSVAVFHRGKVVYAEGFGKRNDKGEPVTAEVRSYFIYDLIALYHNDLKECQCLKNQT